MNPSFGRGRGRRPVLQLGSSSSSSSSSSRYLAQCGYQHMGEDSANNEQKEKNKEAVGLRRLAGAYDDSESEDESSPHSSAPVTVTTETSTNSVPHGEGPEIDSEVANFLAEINAISVPSPEQPDIPLPPGAFIPRDQTAEVLAEKHRAGQEELEEAAAVAAAVHVDARPARKAKNYTSMFVKGGSELLGEKANKKKYTSKFVKGGTEVLGFKETEECKGDVKTEEEYELPEAPSTVWQQCRDEKTQYVYYWNQRSNLVTWDMPVDYTQYLLLLKEYEEKLAHIPEDIRKQLKAKQLSSQTAKKSGVSQTGVEAKPVPEGPQLPEPTSSTSSPVPVAEPSIESSQLNIQDIKAKCKLKKAKKMYGPDLPADVVNGVKSSEGLTDGVNLSLNDVDKFVSDILSTNSNAGLRPDSSELAGSGRASHVAEEEDFDVDDIDAALERALERKISTSKKSSDDQEGKDCKSKTRKHDRRDRDGKKDKHEKSKHKSESQNKRTRLDDGVEVKKEATSEPKKARLVAAYGHDDDDSEEEDVVSGSAKPGGSSKDTEVTEDKDSKDTFQCRPVPSLIKMKDDVEDAANIALGKLEFLEVTKKGLSKLQVLLLELQTRFRDWQDGGLDTEYFLSRLHEGNRQLEQYEGSAVPTGFTCHWDRNFRRYFYTNEKTGESQWDYPSSAPVTTTSPVITGPVSTTSAPANSDQVEVTSSKEPALPEDKPPSPHPQPPPPPPDEEEPMLYGPHLPVEAVSDTTPQDVENASNAIDGEPMAPDSSEETVPSEEAQVSESDTGASVVFPGEPPPPGTEVLFGLPPPPPPSDPYPEKDNSRYSAYHDSGEDADMDVDEPDVPKSPTDDVVSSSAQDYQHASVTSVQALTSEPEVVHRAAEAVDLAPVIFRAPQLILLSSISSSASVSAAAVPAVQAAHIISSQPVIADGVAACAAATVDMFAESDVAEEISSTSVVDTNPQPPPPPEAEKTQKKKKKKEKSMTSSSLSLKKKNVSSLVQKWQQVKVQVEEEEKVNEERQMAIRQKLEEWKQAHS